MSDEKLKIDWQDVMVEYFGKAWLYNNITERVIVFRMAEEIANLRKAKEQSR